jgi:hypothetical protein
MKFGLRFNSAGFLSISLVFALPGLVFPGASLGEEDQSPGWQVTRVKQKGWNDRPDRGLIMYTRGTRESGAAFRCYLGEMYAFLLTEPTDVVSQVLDRNRRGTTLAVSYSINDGAETSAHWRRSQGSKIYDVRGTSSIKDVFLAATEGETISVSPKYHDTVIFSLHKAEPAMVRAFLEACDLKERLYR